MAVINHEYYVSHEIAKLLKEAGFDWEVKFFYRDGILRSVLPDVLFNGDFEDVEYYYKHIGIPRQSLDYNDGSSKFLEEYSAPTLDVAQRWLREIKGWEAQVAYGFDEEGHKTYVTECGNPKGDLENYIVYFPTYEEALEACIKKALELILEKGE